MFNNYSFWGMHLIWWILWIFFIFWIFAMPYGIPGQRLRRESPLDILQRRLASGQITNEEYQEKKKILENDLAKRNYNISGIKNGSARALMNGHLTKCKC